MLSAFQRAKAVSLWPCFAECIRLAKKMNLVRREMQPTLNYYFILLCNDSTKDLAAEYIVNTLSKNKLSILISICLIKKKKKRGGSQPEVRKIIIKAVSLEKCLQTGNAQKSKLFPSDPRLSELHEFYIVQGPISSNSYYLKLTDWLKGQGNTSLGWCSLKIKGSRSHPVPQVVSLCTKAFTDLFFFLDFVKFLIELLCLNIP